ncbi:GNAT family N-acetyltransferase [Nocardioides humi]|uniref:GNAT family N-acetyltransferase n=1 Tax=Nocardioides humi TaxID=449461 RepID=A0ABN2BRR5_9ACTN|nr:GNAT family N-acetyltransferase [Nocardioides humi]
MSDAPDNSTIRYVHAPDEHRYEIRDGEALVGFTEYRLPDDVHVDFVHTEVDDAYGGRGLAGGVVEFALADVRAQGRRIVPHCPYVAKWITQHPEYEDITDRP